VQATKIVSLLETYITVENVKFGPASLPAIAVALATGINF